MAPVEHISRKTVIPLSQGDGAEPVVADETITVRKQKRTRRRYLEDGTMVWEEQDYVVTERTVVQEPVKREDVDAEVAVRSLEPGEAGAASMCVD